MPSTYSSERLLPLSGYIRDGAHQRVAPPWPTISASASRCNSRSISTRSFADAARRSPQHGQGIPVESIQSRALALQELTQSGIGAAARRDDLKAELVLVDRIVFRPVPRPPDLPPVKGHGRRARLVYEFTGEASLSKLFADLIYVSPMVAPTGRDRTCTIQVRDFIAR